jgi:hypothetical protein
MYVHIILWECDKYCTQTVLYYKAPVLCRMSTGTTHISPRLSSPTPGVFYTCFYDRAHRLRLEKLLYLELSRSSDGYFKVLLDPGGGFTSETAARRFQKQNGRYVTVSEVKRFHIIYNGYIIQWPFFNSNGNGKKCPFGCSGYVR